MAEVDVMDETFLVADRGELAPRFADPAVWPRLWPDLRLHVFADRGDAGIRWSVSGAWTGSMEIWFEPVGDGTVLHYFLRIDPSEGTLSTRRAAREAQRRQRAAKGLALALKADVEAGRAPGEPAPGRTGAGRTSP